MYLEAILKAVLELLRRSSVVSYALASACLAAALTFFALSRIDPDSFRVTYGSYGVWFWLGAVVLCVLGSFLRFREQYANSVHFVPDDHRCFAHLAVQPDGRTFTQISGHFQVFSRVDHAVRLLQVRLARPYLATKIVSPVVFVRSQNSNTYGSKHLVPGNAANKEAVSGSEVGITHFYVGDITPGIRRKGIVLEISDHLGNWHKVKLPHLNIS